MILRGFVCTSFGQVHYRTAGSGPPILLCHASPGSSKQLEGLILELAKGRTVFAPDTPGNGDSSPLNLAHPQAADYARGLVEFMDGAGLARCDAYGSHTGAAIAAELAILAPDRLELLVLDGLGVFDDAERTQYLDCYANAFEPDLDGAYLLRAFMFCRDQYLFFPWYARDRTHRRDGGLPPPARLHDWVLEVLKASQTYPLAYHAAFAYPALERARLIRQPTLALAAEDDPLRQGTEAAAAAIPGGQFLTLPAAHDGNHSRRLADAIAKFCGDAVCAPLKETES
jgi:pimeloyl-ACP methyl ester carboxylesterase